MSPNSGGTAQTALIHDIEDERAQRLSLWPPSCDLDALDEYTCLSQTHHGYEQGSLDIRRDRLLGGVHVNCLIAIMGFVGKVWPGSSFTGMLRLSKTSECICTTVDVVVVS